MTELMNDFPNTQQPQQPKKKYLFYRILGYINNFVAIFFLFLTLMSFAITGFQSSVLLYLFIFLAILIYTNLTAVFGRHVMVRGNNLRSKLKDWIKVNAIVALLFAGFMLASILFVFIDQSFVQKVTDMYANMEGVTSEMAEQMVPMLKGVLVFFGLCMLILIIHVILTFRYLKMFGNHFSNEPPRS